MSHKYHIQNSSIKRIIRQQNLYLIVLVKMSQFEEFQLVYKIQDQPKTQPMAIPSPTQTVRTSDSLGLDERDFVKIKRREELPDVGDLSGKIIKLSETRELYKIPTKSVLYFRSPSSPKTHIMVEMTEERNMEYMTLRLKRYGVRIGVASANNYSTIIKHLKFIYAHILGIKETIVVAPGRGMKGVCPQEMRAYWKAIKREFRQPTVTVFHYLEAEMFNEKLFA
jgi:hypothetical protein